MHMLTVCCVLMLCRWVQVACPRLSIDWGLAFDKPLLTPYEVSLRFCGLLFSPDAAECCFRIIIFLSACDAAYCDQWSCSMGSVILSICHAGDYLPDGATM